MPPVESTLTRSWLSTSNCTVPKVIDFPIYKTKSSGENEILCGILRVVSRFSLHFVLYLGNLSYFSDSVIPHPNFTWSGCRCDPSLRWCPPGPGAGWWVWGRGWDGDCGNHLAYPRLRGKEQTQPSGGFALTMQRCGSGSVPLWSDPDMFSTAWLMCGISAYARGGGGGTELRQKRPCQCCWLLAKAPIHNCLFFMNEFFLFFYLLSCFSVFFLIKRSKIRWHNLDRICWKMEQIRSNFPWNWICNKHILFLFYCTLLTI